MCMAKAVASGWRMADGGWLMIAVAGRIALVLESDHTAVERESAGGAERWDVDG
jgi:hypothetical protein